ncbi:MAG: response regulator [Ruminococcaceae bacterium]|nr:response regulator [Oscillospiraceae bacterium]
MALHEAPEINWEREYSKLARQQKKLERDYRALALMHEQTERLRNANEAAKETANFYNRLLLANTPGITFMLDLELCFVLGSEKVVAILGYTDMREMVGVPFDALFTARMEPHWVARMAQLCRQVMESGEAHSAEELVTFRDGGAFVFRIDITPAAERDGVCRGAVVVMSDVTELIHAKETAEMASGAKSEFLARMSHEIRTPLNAVTGMAHIARNTTDAGKIQSCLAQIESSSNHLLGIINDILDFSRAESGRMPLEETDFSLRENIGFVLTMLEPKAKEQDIHIHLDSFNVAHDVVTTDALRLNQVLVNLLSNAVKFSHAGGTVRLRVNEFEHVGDSSIFRFDVVDEGIGISPQQASRLFRPFEQANVGVARTYGGTGLGLAISKNLVEMLGGEIDLDSREGEGSTFGFTIRCPAKAETSEPGPAQAAAELSPEDFAGKRGLVVDDIAINREIIRELLADSGLEIETAASGKEALEAFSRAPEHYYDIILMDIQMPEMDGCTATSAIRALPRADAGDVRIVAMTANVLQEDVNRAMDAGMDAYLNKPIEVDNMVAILRQQLAGQGGGR